MTQKVSLASSNELHYLKEIAKLSYNRVCHLERYDFLTLLTHRGPFLPCNTVFLLLLLVCSEVEHALHQN